MAEVRFTVILPLNLKFMVHFLFLLDSVDDSDAALLDHEEEFYYTEIEISVESVTKTFSDMCTTSSPSGSFTDQGTHIPDHDYQKKEHRHINILGSSVPANQNTAFNFTTQTESQPINIKRSLSWQNTTSSYGGLSVSILVISYS